MNLGLFNRVYFIGTEHILTANGERFIDFTELRKSFTNLRGKVEAAVLNREKRELHLYAEGMVGSWTVSRRKRLNRNFRRILLSPISLIQFMAL